MMLKMDALLLLLLLLLLLQGGWRQACSCLLP